MTAFTQAAEQGFPAPPEPGLTAAQMIARAEALVPELVGRQAETEQRGFYGEEIHAWFARNGFYRILVPRRYGGYEFGFETFLRISAAIARGCPSTGWMYCLGASHALVAATLFGEQAQAELFSAGDFICPGSAAPAGFRRACCWRRRLEDRRHVALLLRSALRDPRHGRSTDSGGRWAAPGTPVLCGAA